MRIQGYYDLMQYPILFPYGTYGYDTNTKTYNGRRITCREYYIYMLQVLFMNNIFVLMIDHYCYDWGDFYNNMLFTTTSKLRWEGKGGSVKIKIIFGLKCIKVYKMLCMWENIMQQMLDNELRRDLTQRYEDDMVIVLNDGKPNIFLTMTCNPSWGEITSELHEFETVQERPDLKTRIF
ncbi:hypothetical protein Lal_00021177 [Lupinus albus]|nr:hypothetical protein Lal_00021177 [Lupinus albus]